MPQQPQPAPLIEAIAGFVSDATKALFVFAVLPFCGWAISEAVVAWLQVAQ